MGRRPRDNQFSEFYSFINVLRGEFSRKKGNETGQKGVTAESSFEEKRGILGIR